MLLDDMDKGGVCLGHYLKIWADNYPYNIEYKGGTSMANPIRFIITSNYTIQELFNTDD